MIQIRVAGHLFGIETKKSDAMQQLMASNYTPFIESHPQGVEPLLFVADIDKRVTLPEEAPIKTYDYPLTDDNATLRIYPSGYILSIHNIASGKTFSMSCPLTTPEDEANTPYSFSSDMTIQGITPPLHIIDHLLIFAFSIAGASHKTLLIHASTIVCQTKAVMFLGESGTGKSTHSRMWLENIDGTTLLNDDAPAVRVENGIVHAYGTPWSGKTPCYIAESHRLAAVVRIKRAPYNAITRQSALHAFGAILPSCLPTLQQNEQMLDNVCNTLSDILRLTPVYVLECLPNGDAAHVSHAAIYRS